MYFMYNSYIESAEFKNRYIAGSRLPEPSVSFTHYLATPGSALSSGAALTAVEPEKEKL